MVRRLNFRQLVMACNNVQVLPGTAFRLVIALLMGKGAGSCYGLQHKLYTTDEGRMVRWQDFEWG